MVVRTSPNGTDSCLGCLIYVILVLIAFKLLLVTIDWLF